MDVPVNLQTLRRLIFFLSNLISSLYSSKSYDFTNSGPNELKCFEFIVSIAQPSESIHIKKSFSLCNQNIPYLLLYIKLGCSIKTTP